MSIDTNKKSPSGEHAESRFGKKSAEQMPEESGLTGESVDFNSVLSAVSGNGAQEIIEEGSQKDLNISNVIANIQDEGPAAQTVASSGAAQDTAKQVRKPPPVIDSPTAGGSSQQTLEASARLVKPPDQKPPPQRSVPDAVPTPTVDHQGTESPVVTWTSMLKRLALSLLVLVLAGMGYMLYRQGLDNQLLQSELVQLWQQLQQTEASVAVVSQQLQQQRKEMRDLVTSAQMQQRLESQRQDIDAWLQTRMADTQVKSVQSEPVEQAAAVVAKPKQNAATGQPESANTTAMRSATSLMAEKPNNSVQKQTQPDTERRAAVGQKNGAGKWLVHLASYGSRHQAEKALLKYTKNVPDADIQAALAKGKQVYRISVTGFRSKQEALAYRDKMHRELGLKGVWVARYKKPNNK